MPAYVSLTYASLQPALLVMRGPIRLTMSHHCVSAGVRVCVREVCKEEMRRGKKRVEIRCERARIKESHIM